MTMRWLMIMMTCALGSVSCSETARFLHLTGSEPSLSSVEKHVKDAPYTIRGKRYTPMSVAQALKYSEVGNASWYGGHKSRMRTSSGEYINPRASLTAAHKTLPMPCKVRVTCLTTGKSVVVRINNRGPFHSNRLIDLTTAGAHRISLHGRGVGKVKIEVVSVGDPPYEVHASS